MDDITTLLDLERVMTSYLDPRDFRRVKLQEWLNAKQTTTVTQYVGYFNRLRPHLKDIPDDAMREKFLSGLQDDIRRELEKVEWSKFDDMSKQAIKLSTIMGKLNPPLTPTLKGLIDKSQKENQNDKGFKNEVKKCLYCKGEGHVIKDCPKAQQKNLIDAARKKNKIPFKVAKAYAEENLIAKDGSIKK